MSRYLLKGIFILLIFTLLWRCSDPQRILNSHIIPIEKMVIITKDVLILEAKIKKLNIPKDSAILMFRKLEKELFEKHRIDSATYYGSHTYYQQNVVAFYKIYENIVDSLSVIVSREQLRNKLKNKSKDQEEKTDSLDITTNMDSIHPN